MVSDLTPAPDFELFRTILSHYGKAVSSTESLLLSSCRCAAPNLHLEHRISVYHSQDSDCAKTIYKASVKT